MYTRPSFFFCTFLVLSLVVEGKPLSQTLNNTEWTVKNSFVPQCTRDMHASYIGTVWLNVHTFILMTSDSAHIRMKETTWRTRELCKRAPCHDKGQLPQGKNGKCRKKMQASISCKFRVLKQFQSALLCCVSHITILPVFTCVRRETRRTFVTCFCPFRHRTSKFVHLPLNMRSINTSHL